MGEGKGRGEGGNGAYAKKRLPAWRNANWSDTHAPMPTSGPAVPAGSNAKSVITLAVG